GLKADANHAGAGCVRPGMKRPLALLILAVAICASGATAYALNASAPAKARQATKVSLRRTALGRILVDNRGRTLYLFRKDARRRSRCGAGCASAWPPLRTTGRPLAGAGMHARRLGSIRRSDGSRQVTY